MLAIACNAAGVGAVVRRTGCECPDSHRGSLLAP